MCGLESGLHGLDFRERAKKTEDATVTRESD